MLNDGYGDYKSEAVANEAALFLEQTLKEWNEKLVATLAALAGDAPDYEMMSGPSVEKIEEAVCDLIDDLFDKQIAWAMDKSPATRYAPKSVLESRRKGRDILSPSYVLMSVFEGMKPPTQEQRESWTFRPTNPATTGGDNE